MAGGCRRGGAVGVGTAALLATLVAWSAPAGASGVVNRGGATDNPIRKVLIMLQAMQSKVEAEGRSESELFDKYMCYCKTNLNSLKQSIGDAETKIPQLETSLKEWRADNDQVTSELTSHKKDRGEAQESLQAAKSARRKEADDFEKERSGAEANIRALGKAIDALRKGVAGEFLQTDAADTLRRLALVADLRNAERDSLASFLSVGDQEAVGYQPQSGEILGILEQLRDSMISDLQAAGNGEARRRAEFASLEAAKDKETEALGKAIQDKTTRLGDLAVEIASAAQDLESSSKALAEDRTFLGDLQKSCEEKKDEWEERSETRAEELKAIADTIKILNDDDALELFKKTLPSPSLLQVTLSNTDARRRARVLLQAAARGGVHSGAASRRIGLMSKALRSKKASFDKIVKMMDEMFELLASEQTADDDKKKYCEAELAKSESQKATLEQDISDLGKVIESDRAGVSTLKEEILGLENAVRNLDKDVAEATALRKAEHAEFIEEMASSSAAQNLLSIARNRLSKFYGPKAAALSQDAAESGGRDAPSSPPEAWGEYQKKTHESSSIISMIDLLSADIAKELKESVRAERHAQAFYEQYVADSRERRGDHQRLIAEKEGTKADLEAKLHRSSVDLSEKRTEALANSEYISGLHRNCDWLLENYDARATARAGEVESLKQARAILSGAVYGFQQVAARLGAASRAPRSSGRAPRLSRAASAPP